jgi:glycosyltransferase involved in cell wall biosynthesis
MTDRYGLDASVFEYGVDRDVYTPRPVDRRRDTVIFYSRMTTPRRATSLGVQALGELARRRPDIRIVHFGDTMEPRTEYPFEHVGIVSPQQLSWLYSEATVGLSLSMTNFSLVPKEMMACGLPVVELDAPSARSIFGDDGPIELSAFDPYEIADHVERLLDDRALWESRSRAGTERVAHVTWDRAAVEVEHGVREALRARERSAVQTPASG